MSFGQYVRQLRTSAHLSQRALAERLGIAHVTLGEVERGGARALAPRHWPALVAAIGADADELARLARPEVESLREENAALRAELARVVGLESYHGV